MMSGLKSVRKLVSQRPKASSDSRQAATKKKGNAEVQGH